jgi:hypothetical protein
MSVEHLEALRFIILGSGMKLWDPPLSLLSTSVLDEGAEGVPASPSNFALPPIKQQAKAKLCGDITMFCSKLDAYKIKRGQSGCVSLRGQDWNLSGESYRAMIKEITDTVHQWETELIELIDRREELVSTSQSRRGQLINELYRNLNNIRIVFNLVYIIIASYNDTFTPRLC